MIWKQDESNSYFLLGHNIFRVQQGLLLGFSWFTCNVCLPVDSGTYLQENVPSLLSFNTGSTKLPLESMTCKGEILIIFEWTC